MIFGQSGDNVTLTLIWHIGAIMLFVDSFWFWFCFKVDVAAEGNSPFNIDLRRFYRSHCKYTLHAYNLERNIVCIVCVPSKQTENTKTRPLSI